MPVSASPKLSEVRAEFDGPTNFKAYYKSPAGVYVLTSDHAANVPNSLATTMRLTHFANAVKKVSLPAGLRMAGTSCTGDHYHDATASVSIMALKGQAPFVFSYTEVYRTPDRSPEAGVTQNIELLNTTSNGSIFTVNCVDHNQYVTLNHPELNPGGIKTRTDTQLVLDVTVTDNLGDVVTSQLTIQMYLDTSGNE